MKKVVGGIEKKIVLVLVCESQETDRHDLTSAVKVALNPNTTNLIISVLRGRLTSIYTWAWHTDGLMYSGYLLYIALKIQMCPTVRMTLLYRLHCQNKKDKKQKTALLHEPCKSPSKELLIVFFDESLW